MSWQAKLRDSGKDRVRWLNGMVTNNIRDLRRATACTAFVLTPQGHNQGDLMAYNRGDYLLLTTDREQAPKIAPSFERYIIMDKVEVGDISDKLSPSASPARRRPRRCRRRGIDVAHSKPARCAT